MRKIITMVVMIVFIVNMVIPPRAEANPAVLAIGMVPPVATMLVAAGVTVGTVAGLDTLSRWWYSEAPQDVRNQLAADWSAAVDGVMKVSNSVWNNVRTWVQSRFATGQRYVPWPAGYYTYVDIVGHTWGIATYGTEWWLTENGRYMFWVGDMSTFSQVAFYVAPGADVAIYRYRTSTGVWEFDGNISGTVGNISYTGADVLTNPAWDFGGGTDGRRVAVPPVIDGVVGKTYQDVIIPGNTTIPDTPPDTTVGDYTGVLGYILGKVSAIADAFTTGLIGDMSSVHFPSIPSVTSKFPFSLPWDLSTLFGMLYASPQCPQVSGVLGGPFGNAPIQIDVSKILPDDVMQKVRLLELLGFAVGLVLITRRLLGGAE